MDIKEVSMSAQAKQHLKREALVGFYLAGVQQIALRSTSPM
jgi:hypothetical protein